MLHPSYYFALEHVDFTALGAPLTPAPERYVQYVVNTLYISGKLPPNMRWFAALGEDAFNVLGCGADQELVLVGNDGQQIGLAGFAQPAVEQLSLWSAN